LDSFILTKDTISCVANGRQQQAATGDTNIWDILFLNSITKYSFFCWQKWETRFYNQNIHSFVGKNGKQDSITKIFTLLLAKFGEKIYNQIF